jgi:peptide/nickel transport system permease protein
MFKYILKRLGLAILILLGVSLILYILVRCMPVNFVESKIAEMNAGGAQIPQATIDAMYEMYGLTDSSFLGLLKGYWSWLCSLARFDLGTSFLYGVNVLDDIVAHMGVSFIISFIAIILEYLIAIPLGVTAATHQYSLRDYIITIFVVLGISLPSFFFGQVLKDIFANKLGWFPPSTLEDLTSTLPRFIDQAWHLVLPIVTIVILSIGGTTRYTRTNMLEVLNSDYIRTARAKGLSESKVIYKHAFRNTMIPIVTMMAGILPSLFSGSMLLEQVFDLPGIGNRALSAMLAGDIPYIMGYNMFLAFLSVLGVLLSDLMYGIVDPRVKLA